MNHDSHSPHWAVTRLLATYADRIDAGDFDGVAELFEHGEIRGPDGSVVAAGQDEVRALYERTTRRYEDGTPKTKHLVTNVIVDVDPSGTRATARSTFVVLQAVPGELVLQPVIAGTYADEFTSYDPPAPPSGTTAESTPIAPNAPMPNAPMPNAPTSTPNTPIAAGTSKPATSWRFTSRQMRVDLVGDLGHHLLFDIR